MSERTDRPSTLASRTLLLLLTLALSVGLVVLLLLTERIEADGRLGFLAPYKDYVSLGLTLLLGIPAVQTATRWVYAVARRRISAEVAGALRVIARLVGYGLLFSFLVSLLTDNVAAALTMGSFAGVIAGFAAQTVMGNTVAGIFLAIGRPIGLGDQVTIDGNSGTIADITLMHVVLDADDRKIFIPTAQVISEVLVEHKASE